MKLRVTGIKYLGSGSASVELGANVAPDAPKRTEVDTVTFRVFIPVEELPDSVGDIRELAIQAVRKHVPAATLG